MEPLATIQQSLTWLSLYPTDNDSNKWMKRARIVASSTIVLSLTFSLISFSLYVWKFKLVDCDKSLIEVVRVFIALDLLYTYLTLLLVKHKIKAMFDHLLDIYNDDANQYAIEHLVQTNNQCERMWPIYVKIILCVTFCVFVMYPVSMLYCWMNGNFDPKYFFRTVYLILPWDQQTIVGYIAELCFLILYVVSHMFANGSILILFISVCLHNRAFYKMFQCSTLQMNTPDENRNDEEHLERLTEFHISVKNWFLETTQIFSPFIMVHMVCSVVVIAGAMFHFDMHFDKMDHNFFVVGPLLLVYSTLSLFIYCYFGGMSTTSFEKMADCLYKINQPDLPIKLQKYLIIMITNVKRPIHYHGFKMIVLNMETFLQLLTLACKYYMIFRTFSSMYK